MIRQYIALSVVVIIAVFVVTQLEWNSTSSRKLNQPGVDQSMVKGEMVNPVAGEVSFSDLRVGGASKIPRQRKSEAFFSPLEESVKVTAASSSPFSATSTPFQAGPSVQTAYSGTNIEFSNPGKSVTGVKNAASTLPENKSESAPNSPENISSRIEISGHIVDGRGEPISGLALTLKLRQASAEDKARFGTQTLTTRSDTRGAYAFINLVEGEYQVCTSEVKAYKAACQNPHAPHSSADFSLHNVLIGRVYGTVRDEQGKLLSEVTVSATPGQKNRAVSDKKGQFSLNMAVNTKLNYRLYFAKERYTRKRVSVNGRDILAGEQLNIVLEKTQYSGFAVKGTIYDQSGAPVRGRTVTLYSPTVKSALAMRAVSSSNGEFTIQYVTAADDYRLSVNTGGAYTFDATPYANMEIFEGMAPLAIQLQSTDTGSFRAHVVSSNGTPIKGETFTLYSGSAYVGRAISDAGGEIRFDTVPVKPGGSSLRISGGSMPKYTFSGITLAEAEHKSAIELTIDRGEHKLILAIKDESQSALQGAQGLLTWSRTNNGVRSQTMRSRGKISMAGTGIINFSELGQGEHQLQVRLDGYLSHSSSIDINQQTQYEDIVLVKAEE